MKPKRTSLILRGDPAQLESLSRSLSERFPDLVLDPGAAEPSSTAPDLGLLFEHAPVALILVDTARRVLRINREAASLAGQVPKDMLEQVTGVAIGCANAQVDPQGCGHSDACGQCGLRLIIERTFESGAAQRQVETTATFGTGHSQNERKLRISTSLVSLTGQACGLLALEEIVEIGLASGGQPPPQLAAP